MTKVSVSRKNLLSLLSSFGTTVGDLRLRAKPVDGGGLLVASVGYYTHYLRLTTTCDIEAAGSFAISDINAVRSFLKTGKEDDMTLHQEGEGKMLYLTCGNSKIHLPGKSTVDSHTHVATIEKLLTAAANDKWVKWAERDLSCSAVLNSTSTQEVISIHTVLGENPLYTVDFYPNQSEAIVKAGKKSKGRMFVTIPLENVEGPEHKVTSVFGANFPINLRALPTGELTLHMGEDTPIILLHEGTGSCLVVFDCDYEEGWE